MRNLKSSLRLRRSLADDAFKSLQLTNNQVDRLGVWMRTDAGLVKRARSGVRCPNPFFIDALNCWYDIRNNFRKLNRQGIIALDLTP